MNTKLLMTTSAVVLGIVGLILTFAPNEISQLFNQSDINAIVFQLLGALYLGFAMTNWMSKESLIGGIYGRPLCIGNLAHFFIGGIALIKFISNNGARTTFLIMTIIYLVFAIFFMMVFFKTPKPVKRNVDVH